MAGKHGAMDREKRSLRGRPLGPRRSRMANARPGTQSVNAYTSLAAEGRDYAAAFIKHNIDPFRAVRLMADDGQRLALQSYIDSLVPPPVPGTKPAKLDKV